MPGGSSPLILVDNVEIPSIQLLNPDDIESISVLKDAASSSIYGSKAAFGVILITTKKGAKTESVNVSYSGNWSYQNISKKMEMSKNDKWNTINLKTTYETDFGNFSKLNYMLGMNRVGWTNAYNWSQTTQLIDYTNPQFDLAYGTQTTSGVGSLHSLQVGA